MGIINWIQRKLKSPEVGGWHISNWDAGRPYVPKEDYRSLVARYKSWVYACANRNAIECAQVPLRLYVERQAGKTRALFPTKSLTSEQRTFLKASPTAYRRFAKAVEVEEVSEHPFLNLMDEANEFMNSFDLRETLHLCQELTGNAYWLIVRDSSVGMPEAIWPLLPQYVKAVPGKKNFIDYWIYEPVPNEKQRIEVDDMIHFPMLGPKNAIYGYGPLQACVVAADLGNAMNSYETQLLSNNAIPSFALMLPVDSGEPTEELKRKMRAEWRKEYGGINNAGKMAILHGGADLKEIAITPKEMAYLAGRKATQEEIAAVFGVPLSKLKTEDVNRANAEAGDYSYMKDTILPRLRRVEQKLNEKLLPLYDERLFCVFDNPVPEDKEFRLREQQAHIQVGYTSINEERQRDGLEEVDWGNVPILPMTMIPLGSYAPYQELGQEPKAIKTVKRRFPHLGHPTNFVNKPFVRKLQDYYREQRDDIISKLDADADKLKRYQPNEKTSAEDLTSGWFDMQKWEVSLSKVTEPFLRATLMVGGEAHLRRLSTERVFDTLHPKVLTALEKHRFGALKEITSTDARKIRTIIAGGIDSGEGIAGIRSRLLAAYEDMERSRATMIARTETIWAWNEGAVQGYIQSGVVTRKIWLASGDTRSCEFCLSMDGKTVDVEDSFFDKGESLVIGDRSLDFGYEAIGHPPLHANCRCTVVAEIEGI